MDYEKAKRRKNTCITGFLMLVLWGWGGLNSHVKALKENPETGFLFLGLVFGIPTILLLILAVYYSIKVKQAEYDMLDELDKPDEEAPAGNNSEK